VIAPNGQIKQTKVTRRSSGARDCSRRNAEELEVRPASAETTTQLEFSFHPVSPSGFSAPLWRILIVRQEPAALSS